MWWFFMSERDAHLSWIILEPPALLSVLCQMHPHYLEVSSYKWPGSQKASNSVLENKFNLKGVLNTNWICSQEAFTCEFHQSWFQGTIKSLLSFSAEHWCQKKWLDINILNCCFSWTYLLSVGTKSNWFVPGNSFPCISHSWESHICYILAQSSYFLIFVTGMT